MNPDILIIRDGDAYRLLHGHLHLASELTMSNEVFVDIKNEGKVRIVKTESGLRVEQDQRRLPLEVIS